MKKVFCTVMALVLLLPINSLGFEGRVDDEVGVQSCSHVNTEYAGIISISYSQLNSAKHAVHATEKRICNNCGATVYVNTSYQEPHDCVPDGSCNGSTTTVRTICRYCNYIEDVITYPCRGVSCIYPHDTISSADMTAFCCEHQHSHGSRD